MNTKELRNKFAKSIKALDDARQIELEQYANQRVIEELEKEKRYLVLELERGKYTNEFVKGMDWAIKSLEEAVKDIKELKQ